MVLTCKYELALSIQTSFDHQTETREVGSAIILYEKKLLLHPCRARLL
jgi:hypothetical protein